MFRLNDVSAVPVTRSDVPFPTKFTADAVPRFAADDTTRVVSPMI
jgi:hypothetical protein